MKRSISAMLIAATMLSAVPVSAAGEAFRTDGDMITLLGELNIMVGDDNGDYHFDDYVSRAEMAKIAVNSSSAKNTVAAGLAFSPFSDVKSSFWGAPYIQAAVSAGIVDGYIDGTFRPEGTVKYEEAINMMLKVLGYSNDDFGASYPYGQVGMAENLEMTKGVESAIGSPLTRRQVARLVCNALDTERKDTDSKLIAVHNCAFYDDVTIEASSDEDTALRSDEISTSAGKFRIRDGFDKDNIGSRGDMAVKDGKYVILFSPDTATKTENYVIYTTLGDAVLAYREGDNSEILDLKINDTTALYKDGTAYTYASARSSIKMGDTIKVRYKENGEIDRISYTESSLFGPVTVRSSAWASSFDTDTQTKIMRDGSKAKAADIKTDDVIYYSDTLNMIFAYSKKITGIYEKASPSKDVPETVTVSGATYEIEGVEAFNALSSKGSISYGDTVTLLMGRDGMKVAGVAVGGTGISETFVGYVSGAGKKVFENSDGTSYTSYYAEVVTPDGITHTYPTEFDRSTYLNKVVRVRLQNERAEINAVEAASSISGYVSYAGRKIGMKQIADDCEIIDTVKIAGTDTALWAKVYMQRLDGMELKSGNIVYYSTNASGEIDELILQNVTEDMYDYGMVVSASKATDPTGEIKYNTYSILADNSLYTASRSNLVAGTPVQFAAEGDTAVYSAKLSQYAGTVTELTHTGAVIGNVRYKLADKVKVYKKLDARDFLEMSLEEAIQGGYKYTCYYDRSESAGGRVRVIICE